MKRISIGFFALSLTFSAINASDLAQAIEPNQWMIHGIGADSCASYVLALADNRPSAAITMDGKLYYTTANAYTQWILGFVTANNLTMGKPGRGQITIDTDGIVIWVKNYCEAHPTENIFFGVSAFIREHQPKVK